MCRTAATAGKRRGRSGREARDGGGEGDEGFLCCSHGAGCSKAIITDFSINILAASFIELINISRCVWNVKSGGLLRRKDLWTRARNC